MRDTIVRILLVVLTLLIVWGTRRIFALLLVVPLRKALSLTEYKLDERLIDAIIIPIRWFLLAIAILISAEILEVSGPLRDFIGTIGRTLAIIAVLLFFYRLTDALTPSTNMVGRVTGLRVPEDILPFIRTGVKIVVIALGIVIILQEWGYNVSGLVAGLGLGGLALSLAAQDTAANLFGFLALVSDRPFDVGEYIVTPDVSGVVEHVGIRSTRVRQLDQAAVYVPNSKLANSAILNWARLQKRRIDYILGITYDASSDELRMLLHRIRELLSAQELVDPESITVYFINFGDSQLEILVRCYIFLSDWKEFTAEKERINLLVMELVDELGMSIAFPSRSIYVENAQDLFQPQPPEKPKPTLSPRERALLSDAHTASQRRPGQRADEANPTGQQDEPDED